MQAIQERERESAVGLGICSFLPSSSCCSLLLLLKVSSGFLSSTAHEMEGSLWKSNFWRTWHGLCWRCWSYCGCCGCGCSIFSILEQLHFWGAGGNTSHKNRCLINNQQGSSRGTCLPPSPLAMAKSSVKILWDFVTLFSLLSTSNMHTHEATKKASASYAAYVYSEAWNSS